MGMLLIWQRQSRLHSYPILNKRLDKVRLDVVWPDRHGGASQGDRAAEQASAPASRGAPVRHSRASASYPSRSRDASVHVHQGANARPQQMAVERCISPGRIADPARTRDPADERHGRGRL